MADLDAIRSRAEASAQVLKGTKEKYDSHFPLRASARDVPALLAIIDQMTPVIEAARGFVAKRNELHGDPSNPEWWQGQDWALARQIFEYEESQKHDD